MKPCLKCRKDNLYGDYCWECFQVLERDMGINDALEGRSQENCGWPETRCDEHPHCRCAEASRLEGRVQAVKSARGE